MAVSLSIVQGHGGQIDVESERGAGTRFSVRLPVRNTGPAAKSGQPRLPQLVQPGHILFVESEAMIRDATSRLLSRWGHKVEAAENGAEALARFLPDTFDLVISDLGMPDMNGWELLAQIKARDPRVPTVLITGWAASWPKTRRAAGADFVIEKPFDQDDLRDILAQALG
ncbi:MAG: response regulator [Kouleothrix sp.]